MKNSTYYYILFISLIFSNAAYSASLKIEPVYGVERTQRQFPAPARYKTETFIGVRTSYGVPAFSVEFEVNTSRDSEEFPESNLDVTYINHKALLGFRSYPLHSRILGWFVRFGARASKQTREIEENNNSTTEEDPIILDPYAGTGLTIRIANAFALSAGATLVYNRYAGADDERFDSRYTFGFTIKTGSK